MNNLISNIPATSPVFPFEAGNAIFVHDASCGLSCSFTKVHVPDILYIERQHEIPITTIFLLGGSSVDTDASIDEIISACPGSTIFKTWWDEAVNLMHIDRIEGNSFIVGGCRHYLRDNSGVDLRSCLTLCKAERRYSGEPNNGGLPVPSDDNSLSQCGDPGSDIYLFSGLSYERVRFDSIIWISAAGNYCDIHLVGNPNPLCVIFLLGKLIAHLPRHLFVRISRSIIVNLNFVERIQGPILFVPGCRLKVPYQKVRDIPSWFSIPKQS